METDFTAVDIGNNFYRVNANTQRARDWADAQGYDDVSEDQPGGRQAARASPYSIIVTNDDINELIEEVCDAGHTIERQEKSTLTPKGAVGALVVLAIVGALVYVSADTDSMGLVLRLISMVLRGL